MFIDEFIDEFINSSSIDELINFGIDSGILLTQEKEWTTWMNIERMLSEGSQTQRMTSLP
jgi:hypothetical protein